MTQNNNPYQSPESQGQGRRRSANSGLDRTLLRGVPLGWFGLAVTMGLYADNLRYSGDLGAFSMGAATLGLGACVSLAIMFYTMRRWWMVISIPLGLFFATEVLIMLLHFLSLVSRLGQRL